jgi:hypothetical protein
MMKWTSVVLLSVLMGGLAQAQDLKTDQTPSEQAAFNPFEILDIMGSPVYEDKENPIIQSANFSGRFQLQFAYVDGDDTAGADFSEDFMEFRRIRAGGQVKFLKYFKLKGEANWIADGRPAGRDRDWGYQSLDALILSFDADKAFEIDELDKLVFKYGRHKVLVSHEVHMSSKKIKTVERSAMSNKLYPTRATGVSVDAAHGMWSGTIGVFSTDSTDGIGHWNRGVALYVSTSLDFEDAGEVVLDFLWNDANGNIDNELDDNQGYALYEWAVSAAHIYQNGPFQLVLNGSLGDNGTQARTNREGTFWGVMVIPSYMVVEDLLEVVARYSYQGAHEANGIRTNSRYMRRNHAGAVNGGRGDEHHSIYGGLNIYLHGHKAKIMLGIEYETLDTNVGDNTVDGMTYWAAFRTYF